MRKLSLPLVTINYDVCIREEEIALRFKQPSWTRSIRNVRSYFLELGEKLGKVHKHFEFTTLGFKQIEDWYSLKYRDIEESVGGCIYDSLFIR